MVVGRERSTSRKRVVALVFGCCGWGGRAPNTKNAPKRRVVDVRGKGEGADYEKRAQAGVFLVFLGRKANEHVRHAHTGVSYVFCRMWEVGVGGGGPGHEKRAQTGAFFVFFVFWQRGEGTGMLPVR